MRDDDGLTPHVHKRSLVAGGAVAVVGLAAAAFAILPSDDDDTTELQAAGPGTTQPTETEGIPALVAAVTEDGRLVMVDVDTGTEVRDLDPPLDGTTLDGVALEPGGDEVLFATCCEPAGGAVFAVPTDGGPAEPRGEGSDPTFGADSRFVATAEPYGIDITDAEGDAGKTWVSDRWAGKYTDVALSPDGETTVVRVASDDAAVGQLLVLRTDDLAGAEADPAEQQHPEPTVLPGDQWAMPSFDKDGHLVACERTGPGKWSGRTLDLGTGEVLDSWDYPGVPTDQDHDPSGEWLVAVVDGAIRYRAADGTTGVIADAGFRAASW